MGTQKVGAPVGCRRKLHLFVMKKTLITSDCYLLFSFPKCLQFNYATIWWIMSICYIFYCHIRFDL